MLIWDALQGPMNVPTNALVSVGSDASSAYEKYLRIVLRESELSTFGPKKLPTSLIAAFEAMGRAANSVQASYAQWQQYGACAVYAAARARAASKPMVTAPIRAVRHVKAFFVSQKVNGRNAP